MSDDFSDAPVSITEARASRTGLAKDMTARDVLIDFLRDLDNGKIAAPSFLIISFARRSESGGIATGERVGGMHTPLEAYGLLLASANSLMRESQT